MAKVIAITGEDGALLGVFRADPIMINGIEVRAVPAHGSSHTHEVLEVPSELLDQSPAQIHKAISGQIKK